MYPGPLTAKVIDKSLDVYIMDRIETEFRAVSSGIDSLNDGPSDLDDELSKLQSINGFLGSLSSSIDTIEVNVTKVDEGLRTTNGLIDKWAKVLVKSGEISELLLSENDLAKWKGLGYDVSTYKKKAAKYNSLLNKYNSLKLAKEEQEKVKLQQQKAKHKRGERTSRGRVSKASKW